MEEKFKLRKAGECSKVSTAVLLPGQIKRTVKPCSTCGANFKGRQFEVFCRKCKTTRAHARIGGRIHKTTLSSRTIEGMAGDGE